MTYEEEFETLFTRCDAMIISGCVGTRTDNKISFCLGVEQKYLTITDYMVSKLDEATYLLTNKDENKNDRWVVNFYKKMWFGGSTNFRIK